MKINSFANRKGGRSQNPSIDTTPLARANATMLINAGQSLPFGIPVVFAGTSGR
jgi:hypothetical protein